MYNLGEQFKIDKQRAIANKKASYKDQIIVYCFNRKINSFRI